MTQPGRIAIAYSHPEEEMGALRHIVFFQDQGMLLGDLEFLDLEDLPDVRGLKAVRVGVNPAEKDFGMANESISRLSQIGAAA